MNPALEMAAFVGFIAGGTLLFVGQPVALAIFLPCAALLTRSWIADMRVEKKKALWIAQRALLAGAVLTARRVKNGHWF